MAASQITSTLWSLEIPLHVTHITRPNVSFYISVPRFSYLAFLLPRLTAYFGTECSSFHHEEIQLRNLPVGLLVDLYQPPLPWHLAVGDGPEWDIGDTFMNSAKEVCLLHCGSYSSPLLSWLSRVSLTSLPPRQADFVRNGNAKQIMSLSKENTTALWNAVLDSKFEPVSVTQAA